ncbi:MAG TPA: recombinase [Lachnospiraceae bacterium]|nr:recombinase [Lachnospiraceae bacterium]
MLYALVEKIEILSPTHFVFVLKSGMRVKEICGYAFST